MTLAMGPAEAARHPLQWWERRWTVVALVFASMIPLLWPEVIPLVDLPGHMGRYRVQLDLDRSPELQQFFRFEWAIIGNLGVDLIVEVLAPVLGLETTVKLVVMTIPSLTVAGLLWVAREVHGRVPPTALFALPFAYNYPFFFGFANFALAMAMALLAFALWLRLGRTERVRLRIALFVPLSSIIWVVHAFGWGTLGVLAFSAELVRQFDRSRRFFQSAWYAGLHCLALTPPILLMLAWRSSSGGQTFDWFNWKAKFNWMKMVLRDRWELFDVGAVVVALLLFALVVMTRRLTFSRNLAASAFFLLIVYLLLPRVVFGSAYADMRLAPYIFAIALIGIRVPEGHLRFSRALAVAGLAFFLVRLGGSAASMYLYDQRYDRELAALDHLPHGARVVSFVGRNCREPWAMSRLLHLPAMATVRRHAFTNDQWTLAGAQLLKVDYPPGGRFVRDPSQVVTPWPCAKEVWRTLNQSLAHFPRAGFDYVWVINPPPYDLRYAVDLRPIWRSGTSVLYMVDHSSAPAPPAEGAEPIH
ncbi:MAG: hypothetical protein ACK4SZ_01465 [Allosphingosinicella sp.]|uniref:hypothetical protein n=1 Tax=Allosphingosinicella sp. TaxID=2823234 RepID=UPI003936CC8F